MINSIFSLYQPFAEALGWAIVQSLWQATVIALLVRFVLAFTSSRSAQLRYIISIVALSFIFMSFIYTFSVEYKPVQAADLLTSIDDFDIAKLSTLTPTTREIIEAEPSYWIDSLQDNLTTYAPFLALIWVLGVFLLAIQTFQNYLKLRSLTTVGIHTIPEFWENRLVELTKQLGIHKKVRWLASERVGDPITFYHFKPLILVPFSLFSGLTPEQIEVILLHELAHIRRHDYLVNWLQSAVEVVLFYHPAVWWISSQVRAEREYCCDDIVLKFHNNPMLYANALTQISIQQVASQHFLNQQFKNNLAMSANQNKGQLTTRVFRLFGQYEPQNLRTKSAVIAIILLVSSFSMAFYLPSSTTLVASEITTSNTTKNTVHIFVLNNEKTLEYKDEITVSEFLKENKIQEDDIVTINMVNDEKYVKAYGKRGKLGVCYIQLKEESKIELPKNKHTFVDYDDLQDPVFTVDGKFIGKLSDLMNKKVKGPLNEEVIDHVILNKKDGFKKYGEIGKEGVLEITTKKKSSVKNDTIPKLNTKDDEEKVELKSVNGAINLTTHEPEKAPNKVKFIVEDKMVMSASKTDKPLIVVDGKTMNKEEKPFILKDIDAKKIKAIHVLKGEKAIKNYGEKGKNGVIVVSTIDDKRTNAEKTKFERENKEKPKVKTKSKQDNSSNTGDPLIIIDGKATDKDGNPFSSKDIDRKKIHSIKVLKDKTALAKYGTEGRFGVIEIVSKNEIDAMLDFYIAYNEETGKESIKFKIDKSMKVRLCLYAPNKEKIKTLLDADFKGTFEYPWNPAEYSKGTYTARLEVGGRTFVQKIRVK